MQALLPHTPRLPRLKIPILNPILRRLKPQVQKHNPVQSSQLQQYNLIFPPQVCHIACCLTWVCITDIPPEDDIITVSIPLDSDVVAQPPLRTEITLSTGLSFEEFHTTVCDAMSIPSGKANLGYRFSWEPVRTDHRRFHTADDYRAATVQMVKKKRAARTVEPILWIYNEVCRCISKFRHRLITINQNTPTKAPTLPTTSGSCPASSGGRPNNTTNVSNGAIAQTHEYKELQRRLQCAMHKNRIGCRVDNKSGEHTEVDKDELDLWSLMIVCVSRCFGIPLNGSYDLSGTR